MQKTKFICLANSYKVSGRCLAGIELDANNNPLIVYGKPKWIRPVCNTSHGEVPNHIATPFQILNIIELDITGNRPEGYQSENVIFNENSIKTTGNFDRNLLANLCDNENLIFGSKDKAVSHVSIENLDHSLMLVSVNQFELTQRVYDDRPKTRLVFTYNDNKYDFPVTDHAFLDRHQNNPDLLKGINKIYLCLSLGVELKGWYYKLIAGIIF